MDNEDKELILHTDRHGLRMVLGDLEAEIMEAVWQRPPGTGITVREIWDELYPKRLIMYTTVMNTMTRLARKGLLHSERVGQPFVYRAALSHDAFVDHFVGEARLQLGELFAQADVLGMPVLQAAHSESTALGAAFLAGLHAGIWPDLDSLRGLPLDEKRFDPRWPDEERCRRLVEWRKAVQAVIAFYTPSPSSP